MDKPLVSIIVPTKNSSAFLERCLDSVKGQMYEKIELIVVDNFSTDDTCEIAKKYTDLVFEKGKERSSQINFGVLKAKGKYVYRVDSDFVLDPTVVAEAVEVCEAQNIDGVAIHNASDPTISFWSKVRHLERECYRNDDTIVGLRFLTKESFEKIGGFDISIAAAEDYEFHNRFIEHGFKFGRIDAQELHIGEPKTLGEFARKSFYYGQTMEGYISQNKDRAVKQFNPIRPAFITHFSKLISHPVLLAGLIVMTFVKYLMGGFGYVSNKMHK